MSDDDQRLTNDLDHVFILTKGGKRVDALLTGGLAHQDLGALGRLIIVLQHTKRARCRLERVAQLQRQVDDEPLGIIFPAGDDIFGGTVFNKGNHGCLLFLIALIFLCAAEKEAGKAAKQDGKTQKNGDPWDKSFFHGLFSQTPTRCSPGCVKSPFLRKIDSYSYYNRPRVFCQERAPTERKKYKHMSENKTTIYLHSA